MKYIKMADGKKAIIDDEHYEWINSFHWLSKENITKSGECHYAFTAIGNKQVYMHRLIMKNPKGKVVHHKDGNGLNNQKDNLEVISHRENLLMKNVEKSSKYSGVAWSKTNNKWIAQIWIKGRLKYLGSYHEEWRAAKAYRHAFYQIEGHYPKETYQKPKEARV